MIGELPTRLDVNGKSYAIRTDMKDVLKILQAFGDPELKDEEKVYLPCQSLPGLRQDAAI